MRLSSVISYSSTKTTSMTILVFHGDNQSDSRTQLQNAIHKDKEQGREVNYLEGDKLTPRDLESVLGTANLFAESTLVIEGLMGRLRSKDKDACIELLAKYAGEKNILLWEKKAITKLALGKLGKNVKISESKAPTELFAFLELIIPGNAVKALASLHRVAEKTEDILIFTMLARHVSYLIMMKSATIPKFAPWQMGKLRAQASLWSEEQLTAMLTKFLEIDLAVKTGQTKLNYLDHLDIYLFTLLG